jgi:PadR family transcriptional regulator AphA
MPAHPVKQAAEPEPALSDTAYALLGLLSLRPWTTYELAQQMQRSLRWVFSRAERGVYTETKRLAKRGLADASEAFTGKRRSTTYTITPAGERALAAWMATPASPTTIESEALVRLFFADRGGRDDLLTTLAAVRADADDAVDELTRMAGETVRGEAPFVERVAWQALGMRFIVDFHQLLADWSAWAASEVERWPSVEGAPKEPGMAVFEELAARRRHA